MNSSFLGIIFFSSSDERIDGFFFGCFICYFRKDSVLRFFFFKFNFVNEENDDDGICEF